MVGRPMTRPPRSRSVSAAAATSDGTRVVVNDFVRPMTASTSAARSPRSASMRSAVWSRASPNAVSARANSLSRRVRSVRSALTASTSATCVRRLRSSSSCSRISTAAANSAKAACTSAWTCARRRPPRAMPSRSRNVWNTTESAPVPRILGGNTLIATVGCRGFVEISSRSVVRLAAAPRSRWWCRISCTVWRPIHSTERSAGSG